MQLDAPSSPFVCGCSYTPSPCDVVEVDVLLELLQRDWTSADSMPEHTQRQALLLADIAGFD